MTWFKGAHPSIVEMQCELTSYLGSAHLTKKHVARTQVILAEMWLKSRKRPHEDVWPTLDTLLDVSSTGKITGSSIKAAFRQRLVALQEGRCCYCRRWLVNTAHAKPIEHILPRSEYPQFSIEFWNVAVACRDCNGIKTNDVWGSISTSRRRYPRPTEFSEAFHPRFHRYDEHIRYVRVETNSSAIVAFSGLTPQGQHLCLTLLHKIAAKETLIANNPALKLAVAQLQSFESKAEYLRLTKLEEFRNSLDRSLMRLVAP